MIARCSCSPAARVHECKPRSVQPYAVQRRSSAEASAISSLVINTFAYHAETRVPGQSTQVIPLPFRIGGGEALDATASTRPFIAVPSATFLLATSTFASPAATLGRELWIPAIRRLFRIGGGEALDAMGSML